MEVHKFGGVCTKDITSINQILKVLKQKNEKKIVVLSATTGITNYLTELCKFKSQEIDILSIIKYLRKKHLSLILDKSMDTDIFDITLNRLQKILNGVVFAEEINEKTTDMILSFGERLISIIMSYNFSIEKLNPIIINPENLIVTDGNFQYAEILLDETKSKTLKYWKENKIDDHNGLIIIPGYFGLSKKGNVNLLGRSGTDYTATSIAYGLSAKEIIIWKDTLGFMTADPSIVNGVKTIEELSYSEAAELSYYGAKVLHPRSVIPAKLNKIPIYVKNLHKTDIFSKIHFASENSGNQKIKGISTLENLSILRVYTKPIENNSEIIFKIIEILKNLKVEIYAISYSQTSISFLISMQIISDVKKSIEGNLTRFIERMEVEKDLVLICVVGSNIGTSTVILSKLSSIIEDNDVEFKMVSTGGSKDIYQFSIDSKNLNKILNSIHSQFL